MRRMMVGILAGLFAIGGSSPGTAPDVGKEVGALIERFGDDDIRVRDKALTEAIAAGAAAVPFLTEALKHDDPEVAGRAKKALREIDRADYRRQLLGVIPGTLDAPSFFDDLVSDDPAEKAEGIKGLREASWQSTEPLQRLLEIVVERDRLKTRLGPEWTRLHLVLLSLYQQRNIAPDAAYLHSLARGNDPWIYQSLLDYFTPRDEDLVWMADHSTGELKSRAINRMASSPDLYAYVLAALGDESSDVRGAAIDSLDIILGAGGRDPAEFNAKVVAMTRDSDGIVRASALNVIHGRRLFPDAAKYVEFLSDEARDVRYAALQILGDERYLPAREKVIALLQDPSEDVRYGALFALMGVCGPHLPLREILSANFGEYEHENGILDFFAWAMVRDEEDYIALPEGYVDRGDTLDDLYELYSNTKDPAVTRLLGKMVDLRINPGVAPLLGDPAVAERVGRIERRMREYIVSRFVQDLPVASPERGPEMERFLSETLVKILDREFLLSYYEEVGDWERLALLFRSPELFKKLLTMIDDTGDYPAEIVIRLMRYVKMGGRTNTADPDWESFPSRMFCLLLKGYLQGTDRGELAAFAKELAAKKEGFLSEVAVILAEFGAKEAVLAMRETLLDEEIDLPRNVMFSLNRLRSPEMFERCDRITLMSIGFHETAAELRQLYGKAFGGRWLDPEDALLYEVSFGDVMKASPIRIEGRDIDPALPAPDGSKTLNDINWWVSQMKAFIYEKDRIRVVDEEEARKFWRKWLEEGAK